MKKSYFSKIWENRFLISKLGIISMLVLFIVSCSDSTTTSPTDSQSVYQFIYSSDAHYGITRASFQGGTNVNANTVHTVLLAKMNGISTLTIPSDNGVNSGKTVGAIDYLINTGDMSNREETGIQSATASWAQFSAHYLNGLTLKNYSGQKTGALLLPGNHDVSNTIGYYKTMSPLTDNGAMVGIYNYMFPNSPKTTTTFNYSADKIHYSKDISGVHFVFVSMWPDSSERVWIESDLKTISSTTPVILFTHDQPNVESKHFTNPNGKKDINATDKFFGVIPIWGGIPIGLLPIIMGLSMIIQTKLNPKPTDPIQAKVMTWMPVIFSLFFFFFPAGLVLYWVINNIISIWQQWYVNKSIHAAALLKKSGGKH